MIRILRVTAMLLVLGAALSACAVQRDTPLPMVQPTDPIWNPTPDHLDYGQLPL